MAYNFSIDSGKLIVTLDTESGKFSENIHEYEQPNLVLGNDRVFLKEDGLFVQNFVFEAFGDIGDNTAENLVDAYNLLNALILGISVSVDSTIPYMLQGGVAPSANTDVPDFINAHSGKQLFYYDNSTQILSTFDYGSSDWVNLGGIPLSGTIIGNPITGNLDLDFNGSGGRLGYNSANDQWGLFDASLTKSVDNGGFLWDIGGSLKSISIDDNNGLISNTDFSSTINDDKAFVQVNTAKTLIDAKIVTNTTTIILSSATLTSTYPTATKGFKVHCLSIVSGGLIYEKTATGWCQYSVIVTS